MSSDARPPGGTVSECATVLSSTARCCLRSAEISVSWIATKAGEDTEVGRSEPPGPMSNVAGRRTFVAPPAGEPEPVVAVGGGVWEVGGALRWPPLAGGSALVFGLGAPVVALGAPLGTGAEVVELRDCPGALA
jgi:hypothetical protein